MTFDPAIQELYIQNITLRDAMHATRRKCGLAEVRKTDPMPALSTGDRLLGKNERRALSR